MKLKLRIIIFLLQCSMAGFSQTAPGGVSANLRIWLKPEVGITTSGTNVSNWADQSGIATPNNFDQTNATAQPTLTAAAAVYNFHPAINFVTNKFLRSRVVTNAPFTADNLNGTLHVVLNKTSVAGAQDTFGFGGSTTLAAPGTANTPVMGATGGNPYWYDGDWPNAPSIPMTAGKTHIQGFSWRYNVTGSGILSLDGKNASTTPNPDFIQTAQGAILGSQPEEFNGLMQEVIAYERELTLAEKQRVNSYLGIKYGVSLDQTVAQNYLDSGSGIIWNATANAAYGKNIAGIGRDDLSSLNQKESQSVNTGFQVTIGLTTIEPTNAGNTAAFGSDKNFMVWGDDGAAATFSTPTTNGHGVDTRYTRIWKIQETGNVGIVKFAVPSTIGASGKVYLVRSTNPTFDAGDEYIPLTTYTVGSIAYLACDINFNTGDFFTLATNTNPATIALSITPATATVAEGSTQIIKVGFPTGITLVTNTIADYTITGTGINGTDCTTLSGSVTIPAGQNSVDINVAALSDNVLETNETITLTGTTVTSIEGSEWTTVAANKTTTVTITDANPASDKFLSFVPTTISTPEGTATSVVVSLPSGITAVNDITFNYAVSGTASSGSDFTALSGTGTIVAGQNSVSIAVTPLTDSIIEPNETIILTGGAITGSPLTGFTWSSSANTSTITITDVTSAASKILNITPTAVSVAEGSPTTLTVSLPTGITVASPLVVSYTVSGTATSVTDYTALTGSVTIPAGSGSATITVAALTDSLIEANETVIVTGGTTAGYTWGSSDVATVTITDVSNAASKVLSITPATVSIVEGGSTTLTISLPTGVIVASPLTVSYTISGTATSATDYNALSGTVIIPAGSGSTTITVASLSDISIEPDETVILTGGTTSGFTWNASASNSTVTITDVTSPANKTLSFSPTTVSTAEGTTTVLTVSLPTGITSTSPITADYTVTGTATSGTDYTALTGSVTIPAGQNSITINMSALTDGAIESNETVILTGGTITATPLTGFTWNVSANTATVTITDVSDPASKVLSITPSTVDVAEGSNTILTISLPTGVTTANALAVNYTVSGTAISGTDYTALTGSVTIPAGQGSATITLAASADSLIESSETVIITGATTAGFTWNPSANIATITITDVTNAANKVLSITPATVSTAEGTATVLTVSLPTGITTATSIVVNYIVSGTATSATDYTALSGSVTIPVGQGSATINVSALTDGIIESDETVVVTGGTTSGFTWSPSASSSTVTITDVTSAANKKY
ncbi:beta strand repeat-containing protein [Flavobacterium geliluteum]|uniref:Calx-beta domain-containing protein n=1 Tax=Flavobacterium geliluteum TaxID=2816120 RepID=A0A941AW08_9FLAO|nr:Calx-beta domain-containing protein [Flavobacterium geliluteum]MBP4136915.1 hypothetical protein [Flavobacterium geliluteum]